MVRLLDSLRRGAGGNADRLARECGVSRRTVFRDIESLRAAGVPIAFESQGQEYRVDGAHFLPPTDLTLDEALALTVLLGRAAPLAIAPLAGHARSAAAKVRALLPGPIRDEVASLAAVVASSPREHTSVGVSDGVYRTLLGASARKRVVRMRYDSVGERSTIMTNLSPYQMMFHGRNWYVIGKSSLHREVRTFHVGRVLEAEVLARPFRIPGGFSLKRHLRNAWRMIPGDGPDQEVGLRFTPLVARNVADVLWHPTQRCELLADGSLDYRVTVSGLSEIVWWVLGYGDQVEVLEPTELRKQVARRLKAALARYSG